MCVCVWLGGRGGGEGCCRCAEQTARLCPAILALCVALHQRLRVHRNAPRTEETTPCLTAAADPVLASLQHKPNAKFATQPAAPQPAAKGDHYLAHEHRGVRIFQSLSNPSLLSYLTTTIQTSSRPPDIVLYLAFLAQVGSSVIVWVLPGM